MIPRILNIAVIGDDDLVNGMRFAGLSRYATISSHGQECDEVTKALSEFLDDSEIGLIGIQEKYVQFVRGLVDSINANNRTTPVIIELPSRCAESPDDAAKFYDSYAKNCIGFGIQI